MNQENDLEIAIAAISRPSRLAGISQGELPRVFYHAGAAQQNEVIERLEFDRVSPEVFLKLWRRARRDDVRKALAERYSRPIPQVFFRQIEEVGGGEALDVLRRKRPMVVRACNARVTYP